LLSFLRYCNVAKACWVNGTIRRNHQWWLLEPNWLKGFSNWVGLLDNSAPVLQLFIQKTESKIIFRILLRCSVFQEGNGLG
jgi:hypothetical protein